MIVLACHYSMKESKNRVSSRSNNQIQIDEVNESGRRFNVNRDDCDVEMN